MVAARAFGQHPADWIGAPWSKAAYCWTAWAHRLMTAEDAARRQAR